MEFLEFHKQMSKICKSYHQCDGCPFESIGLCPLILGEDAIKVEQIVEQWEKEHPVMTNGQKYQEIMKSTFGEAYPNGVMGLNSSGGEHGIQYTNDWWNAEYQPPKGEE